MKIISLGAAASLSKADANGLAPGGEGAVRGLPFLASGAVVFRAMPYSKKTSTHGDVVRPAKPVSMFWQTQLPRPSVTQA